MKYMGFLAIAFMGAAICAVRWAWWQKFVNDRPDRYGKGPGHDLRGPERGQWDRISTTPKMNRKRK